MGRKRKSKKGGKNQRQSLENKVKALLDSKPSHKYSEQQIIKRLGFNGYINSEIPYVISKLVSNGSIKEVETDVFQSNRASETLSGRVDHVSSRFAYIIVSEGEDIYVRGRDLNSAMHGDTVSIEIFQRRHGLKREGRVLSVLKRSRQDAVGKLELHNGLGFVIPDNKKLHQDIFVHPKYMKGANHNDKVIVEITKWPTSNRQPEGKVVRVLGKAGLNEAEIHSIMAEFGLPFEFSEQLESEASGIKDNIRSEIKKRRDFRSITTLTIDPEDAKDFDDAVSFQTLENGNYEIGIHIADVTHYVRPDTNLEEEALNRATSVYLVDRTIPMLPERLSNQLCSLRPNEEKLTFSVVVEMDGNAKVINEWFGKTVIYSDRRFSYEEAQERIDSGEGDYSKELHILNGLALLLRDRRFQHGAVNFETGEVKFRLDEDGTPLEVVPKVRKDAHKLIEEFMLLANRSVATFISKRTKGKERDTFVYRTHDYPDPERVGSFAEFAGKFGHKVSTDRGGLSQSINRLLNDIEGKPEEHVLQTLAIRSMAKARYTTESSGHFGLAFKHYTHFTSPIRRYPDMMVHRLLHHYLEGGKSPDSEEYEEMCIHSSEREKRAADAERASIKYKQVEFMSKAPKITYEGLISGVTEWGIYVELIETRCEGMVRMADLKDDFYEFDEKNYRVIGRASGNSYNLGEKVKVRIKKTDVDKRIIDLVFSYE